MKQNSNKLLAGIVIGIILLVAAAFLLVLNRPAPEYQSEDSPDGVTHNYLLALQKGDYERAFGYLSPALEHPADPEAFLQSIEDSAWDFQLNQDVSLTIESTAQISDTKAAVKVHQTTFYNDGLFSGSPNSQTFTMRLENQNGEWKLVDGDLYWSYCWGDNENCLEEPRRIP